jgi:quinol monooxygenase YgiN
VSIIRYLPPTAGRAVAALWLGLAMAPAALAQPAPAPAPAPPRNAVTYYEADPAKAAEAASVLRAEVRRLRAEPGAPAVMLIQEVGHPERLVVVERWAGEPALAQSQASRPASNARLAPLLVAPPDLRLGLAPKAAVAPPAAYPKAGVVALVHVDVIPVKLADVVDALDVRMRAARTSPGALEADVLQQANRSNHFTVLAAWTDRAAYARWAASAPAKAFRAIFHEVRGAPFEEQLYTVLDPVR